MRNRKFQKHNKKIKKYHYEFISSQNRLEIDEKERNKSHRSIPFRSSPMRNRKFQRHCGFISSKQRQEKAAKESENKNYPSVPFLPEA